MGFCSIIKQIRQQLGISQTAFAKRMHVSFSTVNRWENGHSVPNPLAMATMIELCSKEHIQKDLVDVLTEVKKIVRS